MSKSAWTEKDQIDNFLKERRLMRSLEKGEAKTTSPTIQAQVTCVSEFVSYQKFDAKIFVNLERMLKAMSKSAWTEKDQINNFLKERRLMRSLEKVVETFVTGKKVKAMSKSTWTEKDQIDNFLKERRLMRSLEKVKFSAIINIVKRGNNCDIRGDLVDFGVSIYIITILKREMCSSGTQLTLVLRYQILERVNCVLWISGLYTSRLLDAACKKVLNLLKKGLLV
ncbi:hypothetical protein Tco_0517250 [Tanacetum coccineum]